MGTRCEVSAAQRYFATRSVVAALVSLLFVVPASAAHPDSVDTSSEMTPGCPDALTSAENPHLKEMEKYVALKVDYDRYKTADRLRGACQFRDAKRKFARFNLCRGWVNTPAVVAAENYRAWKRGDAPRDYFARAAVESRISDGDDAPVQAEITTRAFDMAYEGATTSDIERALFCECLQRPIRQIVSEPSYYREPCALP